MFDLEQQALDGLTAAGRRRFQRLLKHREYLARIIAEMLCWGLHDSPAIDRQLALVEDALTGMLDSHELAAGLLAEWAVRDAALIHRPRTTTWCAVCREGGYGLEDMLARLPETIE